MRRCGGEYTLLKKGCQILLMAAMGAKISAENRAELLRACYALWTSSNLYLFLKFISQLA